MRTFSLATALFSITAAAACSRSPGPPPQANEASMIASVEAPNRKGAWSGKTLHLWTTSCDPRSEEARSVTAMVSQHAAPRPSVGLACRTLRVDGSIAFAVASGETPDAGALTKTLHRRGIETSLVAANLGSNGFDGPLAARVLHDDGARERLIGALLATRNEEGDAAIEIDLESMPTSARDDLTKLVRALRDRAPASVRIEVDVHPKTTDDPGWDGPGAHDYAALAHAGAIVRLMTYDLSIGPVPPGPSTKASWVRDVVAYARDRGVPADQLEIGLPAYGYDFPPPGKGAPAPLRHAQIMQLAARTKSSLVRDPDGAPHFSYDAPDGRHEVWLDDATSLGRVLADLAATTHDVRGVAVWGTGDADPKLAGALADLGL